MEMWASLMKNGRFVTKRFVFDGANIEVLKDRATGATNIRPTRVETVSGFICKCAMAACEERFGSKRPSLITHLVNLPRRAAPMFSEHSIGNLIWLVCAEYTTEKEVPEFSELVDEVRKGMSMIGVDFLMKLRGGEGSRTMEQCLKEIEEFGRGNNVDHFGFTSWCKMDFYDVDFGWGRPVWVSSTDASGSIFMNLVILIDGRFGGGMNKKWILYNTIKNFKLLLLSTQTL